LSHEILRCFACRRAADEAGRRLVPAPVTPSRAGVRPVRELCV